LIDLDLRALFKSETKNQVCSKAEVKEDKLKIQIATGGLMPNNNNVF